MCPIDQPLLVVSRRSQAELHHRAIDRKLTRQEVTSAEFVTVRRDHVDLAPLVTAMDEAVRAAATPTRPNLHNVTATRRPFALNSKQCWPEIQDQVVAFIAEWKKHAQAKPHRLERDRLLREYALLISRQQRQQR